MDRIKPQLASPKECTGCLSCVDSCHQKAIASFIGNDGHYYVRIDNERCVGCRLCEITCPVISQQDYGKSDLAVFHAVWNKNDKERTQSASGGAFSAMAHYIIDHGGVVIGATTENVFDVKHIVISNANDIQKLQGSKYTQSNTCGIYLETYNLLRDGKNVLFSGTGCQVGALLSFLKHKKYEGKLITVDLICGGVPSKLLLNKFVENEPYEIKRILSYRTKEHGWTPKGFVYNLKVEDVEGTIHDYTGIKNLVTTAFSTEMTARYSCYNCKFVGKYRMADFTIGDLWGDTMYPKEHYNGLSLVVVHNQKAASLLSRMNTYIQTVQYDEEVVAKNNSRLFNGVSVKQYTIERRQMENFFSRYSYSTLKKIYANDYSNYTVWMIWKIIRFLYLKFLSTIRY